MMNDGMLSQDEIDALLNISSDNDNVEEKESDSQGYLSSIEVDTLGEIGNISFGSSATTLSTLLNQKVEITTPRVAVIENSELKEAFSFQPVSIQVNYTDGFTGKSVFIIKANDAAIIADIMLGGDGTSPDTELNEIHLSAVQEAMNQMMGAAATSMSTIFSRKVDISPPSILDDSVTNETFFDEEAYVRVSFRLMVGDLIDSDMMQLMPMQFAKQLVDQLLNEDTNRESENLTTEVAATIETLERTIDPKIESVPQTASTNKQSAEQPVAQVPQFLGNQLGAEQATIQEASFSNFEKVELNQSEQRNLDMLLDIPLKITVELGRTKRSIKDILDLTSGSIIELDKLAGEPVDILVNDKLIAEGEVVVIDENFGVRVTDIISKPDRLLKLK
ncbi:flagellar motor switch phosphatase FliY [Oceanobacillus chungangensis]|uniref:Flagellar motor switch phosphatase FliY n=1 Tax=Oceanobacillus chungangensis TaxID=1229152 RepID=A0A3D8PPH6_9BACI|nr:flagellar motor switch phosphatase FliY [Oceanobacillus chungangensis]RDW18036.1 flagellar motor switch phosphatase FliY [Oceanobacillus chungangensis]